MPKQMKQIDQELMAEYGIPGLELMERAASGVTDAVLHLAQKDTRIVVLCGKGNNGGDGLAVLRQLWEKGLDARGALLCEPAAFFGDARVNYDRAVACGCPLDRWSAGCLRGAGVVVDAIFGTGFSGALHGDLLAAIAEINACPAQVISVDIPSGVNGETGQAESAVTADVTVTFQYGKPGLYLFPGRTFAGRIVVHRIAAQETALATDRYRIDEESVRMLLPQRPMDSHKGRNGRALLLAGSVRYTGAALLSAAAALRGGTGLLSVAVPYGVKNAFSNLPEAMCIPVGSGDGWDAAACKEAAARIGGQQALALGCGMGPVEDPSLLECVLTAGIPAVLDADALNTLAVHRALLGKLNERIVLTPHPGEMARLLDCDMAEVMQDPVAIAQNAARIWHCIVLLKGATSCVSDGEIVCLNTSGNPGLAKGGSGDTLTGLILALLSQGLSPVNAACAGAYLLGASADHAYRILGNRMLVASDVTAAVAGTIGTLYRK